MNPAETRAEETTTSSEKSKQLETRAADTGGGDSTKN